MKNISILGATGSIGLQTLDVVRKSDDFNIIGVTANSSVDKIKEIIEEFNPKYVAMMDEKSSVEIKKYCETNKLDTIVLSGMEGLIKIATLKVEDLAI